MAKTTVELSRIALNSIMTMECLQSELEELEGTDYERGNLKRKMNLLKAEIEKHQAFDLGLLFQLDERMLLEGMKYKQELIEEVAQMGYLDQIETLNYIRERKRLRHGKV